MTERLHKLEVTIFVDTNKMGHEETPEMGKYESVDEFIELVTETIRNWTSS